MDTLAEIKKTIDMMFYPEDIVELRSPRKHDEFSKTVSGFFKDKERLAQALLRVNERTQQTVYVTLNPVNPTWAEVDDTAYNGSTTLRRELERCGLPLEPRMKPQTSWETGQSYHVMRTAEDADISKRQWILIDIDAGQPTETNSTDAEHADTLAMAKAVMKYLQAHGFPAQGLANSGNGHHVLVRVDLPNDNASLNLVRRFLNALAGHFDGQYGKALIDQGMFNAGRITKAYGTLVYKGEDTADRPRRWSHIIEVASRRFASREMIEEIAATSIISPTEDWVKTAAIGTDEIRETVTRLQEFLDFYGIEHHEPRSTDKDVVIPCVCPNHESHTMDGGDLECVAMVSNSGQLAFCCQHAHCQQFRTWKGTRTYLEETTGRRFNWSGHGEVYIDNPQETIWAVGSKTTQTEKAIAILQSLKPRCTVARARELAAEAGIPIRTLQWAYRPAGMKFERTKSEDVLVSTSVEN